MLESHSASENRMPGTTLAQPPTSSSKCLNKHMGFVQVPWKPGNMIMFQFKGSKPLGKHCACGLLSLPLVLSLGLVHGNLLGNLNSSDGNVLGERQWTSSSHSPW